MQKIDEDLLTYWGLVCLLAFSPLVRGGHQVWAALLITTGIGCLLFSRLALSLWRGSLSLVWSRTDLILLLGLGWVWICLKRPASPPDSLDSFLILLGVVGCFLLARHLSYSGKILKLAFALCSISGLIVLVGLLQVLGFLPHPWWDPRRFMASTFINHNHFAVYLELAFPLSCLLWIAAPVGRGKRFLFSVASTLMGIGLVLSCSRGAWLSLAAAALVTAGCFGLNADQFSWTWRKTIVALVSVLAIAFLATRPPILARGISLINASKDPSLQMRQSIWRGTWGLLKESPLIGQGVGSFLFAFPRHRPAGLYWLINYAHNDYLQLAMELGIVGLAIVFFAGLSLLRRIMRLVRLSRTPWKQALGLGGFIGLGSLAIHSLIDFPWHIPAILFQCSAVCGLAAGVTYHSDPHPLRTLHFKLGAKSLKLARWIGIPIIGVSFLLISRSFTSLVLADVLAHQGESQAQAGKLQEAVNSYLAAIHRAPYRVKYRSQLGENLSRLGWQSRGRERETYFKQAAESYREALALVPNDSWSAHALGIISKAIGDFQEADRWLNQAIVGDPQNPLYWKDWGELKTLRGEAPEATQAFRRAAELSRPHHFFPSVFESLDSPNYFVERGESALSLGWTTIAATDFEIARGFDSNNSVAETDLAISALNGGNLENAEQLMVSVQDPILRAKWFATLGQYQLDRGKTQEAQGSLEQSLKLDPSNVLARQLRLILAKSRPSDPSYLGVIDQLLSLNRPPVFVNKTEGTKVYVVWEPEMGNYQKGQRTKEGWALFGNGSIRQSFVLPPGKVRFRVMARGNKAKGIGPIMTLTWNGRPAFTTEVTSESWTTYEIEVDVKPGDSVLGIDFSNDLKDPLGLEDRNLRLDKVVATWEPVR